MNKALAQAAAGPVACAIVLTGLLVGWVLTGGAGTLHRVRIQVSSAGMYLTIRNLSGQADELTAVSSPVAGRAELVERRAVGGAQTVVRELTVAGHGTLTLTPYGDDVVLENPGAYERRGSVPLVLTFRRAGKIAVDASVSAPGSP